MRIFKVEIARLANLCPNHTPYDLDKMARGRQVCPANAIKRILSYRRATGPARNRWNFKVSKERMWSTR